MSETPPEGADSAPTNAELSQRVDALDGKLDTILAALGWKPAGQAPAGEGGQAQPQDVAAEVRAQFAERDRKAAEAKGQADADAWKTGVDQSLAELREKPPQEPVRRVEQAMWGHR